MQHIVLHVTHRVASPPRLMPFSERTRSFPKPFTPARQTLSHPTPPVLCCLHMPRVTGANAWGRPGNRKASSHRWHQRPNRSASTAAGLNGLEDPQWAAPAPAFNSCEEPPKMSQAEVARQKLLGRASKLWGNNYEHHCRHELTEVPDLVETCMQVYAAQTSTYTVRG